MLPKKSAHEVAQDNGYHYVDTMGGTNFKGIRFNRFTKDKERQGKACFVGFNPRTNRFEIYFREAGHPLDAKT